MDSVEKAGAGYRYEELRQETVPGILLKRAHETPDQVAYRVRKRGVYQERTWLELKQQVAQCAMGMRQLGLDKGKTVALMGDPSEEYVVCELAAQSLGAITYGIYPTSSSKEVRYLMDDGEAYIFFAQSQEYLDRVHEIADQLTGLKHIVVADTRGIFAQNGMNLIALQKLAGVGEQLLRSYPGLFEETARAVKPSDPLSIIYTSGTTGDPKGALISHGKHLAAAFTLIEQYPVLKAQEHRTVIYLPLCHIVGKNVAVTLPLLTRMVPHYGGHIEDLETTIFETAPTVFFTVPRYLQKFASRLLVGLQHSSPVKRFFYHTATKVGRAHVRQVWAGEKNPLLKFLYALSRLLVFRPLMDKVGFGKCVLVICAGAPLPSDLAALWQIYGVNVSDLYGQTETAGAAIASQDGCYPKPGDVGVPPSGWSVRLAESGEIEVQGADMFEGYWKHPELTAEAFSGDGWLKTGDIGEWTSEGRLKVTGRIRDTIVTSGGKTLSPTYIENALRSSQYISEAVVFGNDRKYITALIEIDFDTVSAWARQNGIGYTGVIDLSGNTSVTGLIGGEVDRANADLARVEQVKAFRIIPGELDPWHDGEPITPTRKVKRTLMYEKFGKLIESMYTDEEQELVASEVGGALTAGK